MTIPSAAASHKPARAARIRLRAAAEAWRHALLLLAGAGLVALTLLHAPIPQPAAYHEFADTRALWGIPNAWNVLSNLPFALVGAWGLSLLARTRPALPFQSPWERWPWRVFFAGVLLTTFGSSYYHWVPDNAHLLWDRLPMTVAFMGLLTATMAERVSVRWSRLLFAPLLLLGVASAAYWYLTERAGHGDLRPYVILVQGGSLLLILLMALLYPARYRGSGKVSGNGSLYGALALYALAKLLEEADRATWLLGIGVGGHCLKHVAAAGAVALLAWRLRGLPSGAFTRPVPASCTPGRQ